MTTLESLAELTDEQLIEKVAVEIMGWKKWYWDEPGHGRSWGWVSSKHSASHRDKKNCDAYWGWNPVADYEFCGVKVTADWNHTIQVAKKAYDEYGDIFYDRLGPCEPLYTDPDAQRQVCLAALQATSP